MNIIHRSFSVLITSLLVAAFWLLGSEPVMAGAASRESAGDFSSIRLLNGGEKNGAWQAGLHITLKPGWKTYWRVPGESGVPPQFDWSASRNAGDIAVSMPVPTRFSDGSGDGIGYKDGVVFPIAVPANDPSKPVHLALKLFYAVCNDICVPVQAEVSLHLSVDTVSESDRFRLAMAANQVPLDDEGKAVSVRSIRLADDGGSPMLEVVVTGLAQPAEVDMFVEAEGAYFRKPVLASSSNGEDTFHLQIDNQRNSGTLKGKNVRLTIAAGGTNIAHEGLVQ